jgi:cytochrome c oxidase subunit III
MSTAESALHAHPTDAVGARIGMWLFLLTEMVLFGGLFLLYAVYRVKFPADFHFCALQLDTVLGTVNTVVLLTSSLSMVLAVGALERHRARLSAFFLGATLLLALLFLVNKFFEWSAKIHHGVWPNSPELTGHTQGENIFYGLYYAMTGLHGLHVLVGMGVLAFMLRKVLLRGGTALVLPAADLGRIDLVGRDGILVRSLPLERGIAEIRLALAPAVGGASDPRVLVQLENAGLYWHLVDVIWIFLFPLFYLIS